MKSLKEALISKDKVKWVSISVPNKYGITEKDMIDNLEGFPVGVVVRMMEEQEKQRNKSNIKVFQKNKLAGFDWDDTKLGIDFWHDVLIDMNFDRFFKAYPEYKKYNI